MNEDLSEKELSPEDAKLLVEFFTILAKWGTQAKKDEPNINILKDSPSESAPQD